MPAVTRPARSSRRQTCETLRTLTHSLSWDIRLTGPDGALKVTLGKRQELPLPADHTAGLTRLFQNAAGTIGARSTPGGGRCFHCDRTRVRPRAVGARQSAPLTEGAGARDGAGGFVGAAAGFLGGVS